MANVVAWSVLCSERSSAARNAKIGAVNAEGDRATATVRFGKGAPLTSIPLVKEDGEWKLGSSAGSEQATGEN